MQMNTLSTRLGVVTAVSQPETDPQGRARPLDHQGRDTLKEPGLNLYCEPQLHHQAFKIIIWGIPWLSSG